MDSVWFQVAHGGNNIKKIDDALAELGPFGEVGISKQCGKPRFI